MNTNGHNTNGELASPFLLAPQLAIRLGVSPRTIDTWVSQGLPCIQPGGRKGKRLFRWETTVDWLNSQERSRQTG